MKKIITKATVKELKAAAKMMGLKGYSRMRKAELAAFILSNMAEEVAAEEAAPVQLNINFEAEIIKACDELMKELPNRMGFHLVWMVKEKLYRNFGRQYDAQITDAIQKLINKGVMQPRSYEGWILTDEHRAMGHYNVDGTDDRKMVHQFYYEAA